MTRIVHCFLGLAETEDQKIFLWPQWERCFFLFDPLLKPFVKTSIIKSCQSYEIPLKPHKGDPPEIRRVTCKAVPLGRLRWTYEHNKKWSQKLLEKADYPIRLMHTDIRSANTYPADIAVSIENRDSIPRAAYNQLLTVSATDVIFRAQPTNYWEGLIKELATVIRAVRIGRTKGSLLAEGHFTKRYDSLDLDDSLQPWEYLK